MRRQKLPFLAATGLGFLLLITAGCESNPFSRSRLRPAKYNLIKPGMSKAQVEEILGPPTKVDKKDMILFTKTTYRYEHGKKFVIITFKNDEVNSKDTNLGI